MPKDMFVRKAVVTDVYDGDTVKVVADLGFGIFTKQTVRLAGIDTAELRDKKNLAKAEGAKKFLVDAVLNKEVTLKSLKPKLDKYGRYIAFLYFDDQEKSVNDQMVDNGHAKPYDGKRKRPSHDDPEKK